MPGRRRARIRALTLAAAAGGVAVTALAGCTAAGTTSVSATGKTLTIYLSAPAGGDAQRAQDVLAAERLAFSQLSGTVASFRLTLRTATSAKPSNNARTAIEDSSAIAYLGEIAPGASEESAGITNYEDLLQISPTDTALELTEGSGAVAGTPNRYYESLKSYGRTLARVVPNTGREAQVQVREMRSLGVKRLYVADDGTDYGKAIALALRQAAGSVVSVQSSAAGADAAFYGGRSIASAAGFFNRVAQTNAKLKLFAPSALADQRFAAALSPGLRSVYVSAPGFLPSGLSALAKRSFVAPFEATYHRPPSPEAIFGYEAMAALLAVVHEDGSLANDRSKVVHDFFAIRGRSSVLGTYSISANGDTSLAPYVFSRLQGGRLVPFKFLQLAG